MIKERFNTFSQREQAMLKIAIPIVLLLVAWLFFITPILDGRSKTNKQIEKHQQQLEWMQNNAHLVSHEVAVNRSITGAIPATISQLRSIMNQLIKAQTLSIERIQNSNKNEVNYRLENGRFDRVLQLIKACEERGIDVIQVHITKSKQAGRVNTRLTVAASQS
jgi:type II secretory pathway component PulM